MSETTRRATLAVGPRPYEWEHTTRDLHSLSVASKPLNTYTFRLELLREGHDDSTGDDFDWWFIRLQEAAEHCREVGGAAPVVEFTEICDVNGVSHLTTWNGFLGKDGDWTPRICRSNSDLFEFRT